MVAMLMPLLTLSIKLLLPWLLLIKFFKHKRKCGLLLRMDMDMVTDNNFLMLVMDMLLIPMLVILLHCHTLTVIACLLIRRLLL